MNNIAVIGAGTMGAGIAQLAAKFGCCVRLIEINENVLNDSLAAIKKRLDRSVEKGKITQQEADNLIGRIQPASTIENLQDVGLVIEAVVEDIAIKHKVFKSLEKATSDSTILASNTSSISIGLIAEALNDPSRMVGMHFFNPAPVMPLVEYLERWLLIHENFGFLRNWERAEIHWLPMHYTQPFLPKPFDPQMLILQVTGCPRKWACIILGWLAC